VAMFVFKFVIDVTNIVIPVKKFVPLEVTFPLIMSSNKMAVEHCKSVIPFLKVEAFDKPYIKYLITDRAHYDNQQQ